jgi:hypothetical protein
MNSHPHTKTLKPVVLNICIMVCTGFVVHRLMKCISLQSSNHHSRRDQSLLILTLGLEIKNTIFVTPFTF